MMSNTTLPKSGAQMRWLLIVGLVCSNFLLVVLSVFSLSQSRQQYELRAVATTQTVASAVDQNLSSSIEKINLALRAVADELERQLAGRGIDEAGMNAFLAKHEHACPKSKLFVWRMPMDWSSWARGWSRLIAPVGLTVSISTITATMLIMFCR